MTRRRLNGWLADNLGRRLMLVIADAGYGKTTLLADFARTSDIRCLWYRLDNSDADWVTFLNYLIAAGREIQPGFAPLTSQLLGNLAAADTTGEVVTSSFLSELHELCDRPTMLVLDDYHLVDSSDEIRRIVTHLVERGPETLSLIVASRRRPGMSTGRLAVQAQVAELGTSDLRFTTAEMQDLFTNTYGISLQDELLAQVSLRTEGWGACLQLLYSSLRSLSPSEARLFLRRLNGAEGPIYDFLAEEVVNQMPRDLERLLTRLAILERIEVPYSLAVASDGTMVVSAGELSRWTSMAREMGLLSRVAEASPTYRMHPLLRDFLRRKLEQQTTSQERQVMHGRVARVAEENDWATACYHYVEANRHDDAMRVLNDSAPQALGTGAWGAVADLHAKIMHVEIPPSVRVLLARDLASTRPDAALHEVDDILARDVPPLVRALALQTKAAALWNLGDGQQLLSVIIETVADISLPKQFVDIARAHQVILGPTQAQTSLTQTSRLLQELGERQASSGASHHAAISFHNALCVEFERGDLAASVRLGERALELFAAVDPSAADAHSTHALMAVIFFELGMVELAEDHLRRGTAVPSNASADAFTTAAGVMVVMGDSRFDDFMSLAAQRSSEGRIDWGGSAGVLLAQARADLAFGRPTQALTRLAEAPSLLAMQVGFVFAAQALQAIASTLTNPGGSAARLDEVASDLAQRGAWYWHDRVELARCAAHGDHSGLASALKRAHVGGRLALPEMADVIASHLHVLDHTPESVQDSIRCFPGRWLPALRRTLESNHPPSARAAAELLSEHGTISDVPRLVAHERRHNRARRVERPSRQLVRRVSPRLVVHDLGRVLYEIGSRRVEMTKTRRRSASLLAYLITRGGNAATRDQVIDAIWPNLDPDAAANSLNQTLYFLRRDIDEFFDELTSPNYVVYESELLWFDAELVSADSIEFLGHAALVAADSSAFDSRERLLLEYAGQFAPEFQYEQWAMSWRETLHATYLHVAHDLIADLATADKLERAARVCRRTLAIDSDATDFERDLVWLYSAVGSRAAAFEQYGHYQKALREDLGLEAPTFEETCNRMPTRLGDQTRGA